ncbi:MAG: hypothetical protein ACFFCL_16275 [Promethearchaeota archaeon]
MNVINLFGQFMKLSKQKINFLTLIFFFIFSSLNLRVNCNEDTWTYTWTNHHDFSNDIDIDSKDSIYVVGKTIHSNDDHDICLLKYNKSGDLIWNQIWNQEGDQSGRALAIDKYDNVYIVGTTNYYKDVIVIKCDSELNPLWNLTLDGFKDPIPSLSIEIDSLDNIYIASYTPNYDIFLVKFNSSGSQLWNSTWGTLEHIEFIDMAIDNLDNIYVLGRSENFYASYLVKFNSFILLKYGILQPMIMSPVPEGWR